MIFDNWQQVVGKTIIQVDRFVREQGELIYIPGTQTYAPENDRKYVYQEKNPSELKDDGQGIRRSADKVTVWTVVTFDDGVIIQEFEDERWEGGNCFLTNIIREEMPDELKEVVSKYL